ncbi:MAG: DUF1553 domain-containing protein [Planctomycetales bacterium]|nr:DUF1553 domain-containing protein [Planctomycetales bacterium]
MARIQPSSRLYLNPDLKLVWTVVTCLFVALPTLGGESAPVSFELDVLPILTAGGCNAGACHGKARGQNGFQLSLLGFDPDFDYESLLRQARGRRVNFGSPADSLLLQKALAYTPHGGGQRWVVDSPSLHLIQSWIEQGAPRRQPDEPTLECITVEPADVRLLEGESVQLEVRANYTDGSQRTVTSLTAFQSNDAGLATITAEGTVTAGPIAAETVVMARYMNHIATCRITMPLPGDTPPDLYTSLPRHNAIDALVWDKLQALKLVPAPPVDDARLLRRLYVDIIGRLPTVAEVEAYQTNTATDKRDRAISELLNRPEYADHWANKWVDLLRPNPYRVGIKAVFNYDHWIRENFRQNRPYDEFVRNLITAEGSTWHNGAVTLFRDRRSPEEITTLVSQLFLGVRLECAKCHHHPFEKWSQEDFYSLAAYFAGVGRKGTGLSPPISGSEEFVFETNSGEVRHPITQQVLPPRPIYGSAHDTADDERRRAFADWLTSDENELFAQVMANRMWADLMGRGLVEPVDDLRATNPPTNEPLLETLALHFREHDYDLKELIRFITSSYVYGLSSAVNERNVSDTRNYSRHYRKRMRAETLLDAVADVTGIPDEFAAMPAGSRAAQLWTHRINSLFLDTFGRPDPNQDPPCERLPDTTVTQALHLMNSPELHAKVVHDQGFAASLAISERTPAQLVSELYLRVYSRPPTAEELAFATGLYDDQNRRQITEDLLWTMINTPEFVFID